MHIADIKLGRTGVPVTPAMHPPVQVIAFTGGKGGTGKSSIAVNVAQALSDEGNRTLLLDADLGMASIDALLGLDVDYTLYDVLCGDKSLGDIVTSGPGGMLLIPAAPGEKLLAELGTSECAGLMRAFSDLDEPIDTLVIDTATGITGIVTSASRSASLMSSSGWFS